MGRPPVARCGAGGRGGVKPLLRLVRRALGHASIATTANTYGHFTKAMAERSADRMTEILSEPSMG